MTPLWKLWIQTTRPKTLFAALAPVSIGGVMASTDGPFHAPVWICTLMIAVLVQIGTNFCNDVFDHRQGADTPRRQGPRRGLHSGRISLRAMGAATVVCFVLVAILSGLLIRRGGMPVLWLALASIFCGVFYTAGRYSLAYTGLADLFVLVFFGPVAVAGTYYLQLPEAGWPLLPVFIAGLGPGLIATGLLTVNNLRDVDEDRVNRKRTLAVRLGPGFSRMEYAACLWGSLLTAAATALLAGRGWGVVSVWVLLPLMRRLTVSVKTGRSGDELNPVLAKTGKLLLLYALLFVCTWPLGA